MTLRLISPAILGLCVLGSACAGIETGRALTPQPRAELLAIQQSPEQTGEPIYEGRVSSVEQTRVEPLFRYERRVRSYGQSMVSTHITRDSSGEVVVIQRATHSRDYALTRAEMIHKQAGFSSGVEVSGNQLVFTLIEDGRPSTAIEEVTEPVIAGPTTFGFILAHWDALKRGESLPVRFAVLERKETIRFALRRVRDVNGRTTIEMKPTGLLVRLAVAPTYFEFDSASRKILGYTGRVPPMRQINDRLQTFDARVDYTFQGAEFR